MLRSQEKLAELQLHPENLGRITISLKVEGGEVHARVWASEASTVTILHDHRDFLQQSLQQQGMQLGSFDLHSGNRGEDARWAAASQTSIPARPVQMDPDPVQEVPAPIGAYAANPHQIEIYA